MLSAKPLANLFGLTFIFAGLIGFVPNPLVAPDGVFAVNTLHNLVHIATGAAFLAGAYAGFARQTIRIIGIAYVGVTVLGFLTTGDMLLGLIHVNAADHWLHAGLAVVILGAGYISTDDGSTASSSTVIG